MSARSQRLSQLKELAGASAPAKDRLKKLFDDGVYTEIGAFAKSGEHLAGVVTACGYVDGNMVYAFSQDSTINKAALSAAQAAKIKKLYDSAAKTGLPVVGIYDSFGADLSDPVGALAAYGELLACVSALSGVVPQIAVVAGTCAGAAAMLAASADFVVMAKDAALFVTPNTAVAYLAAAAAKNGIAALVAESDLSAVEAARELLIKLPANNLAALPMFEYEAPFFALGTTAAEQIKALADLDSAVELYAAFGTAAYTALATVNGTAVGFAATNNADAPLSADDCAKLARFVRTCDAFSVPVVTLVDTTGFDVSDADVTGAVKNMTKLAQAYAEATTVKLAVVTGKVYGPAYIALAGKGAADLVFALPDAVISPLNPLTAAEFLSHDKLAGTDDVTIAREALADEFVAEHCSAAVLAERGSLDGICEAEDLRATLVTALDSLAGKRVSRLPKKHSNMPF
ncbi:MAG: carboxyl transferase domain-containing protein [Oscillospiraceae bacterium]